MASFAWKRVFPNSRADKFAVAAAVAELLAIPLFELTVIMPLVFGTGTISFWMHFLVGFFLWYNAAGNMLMAMGTDVTAGSNILPSVLKPGWHYCPFCMLNSPPRSFHCSECNGCVLVRDHHCVFTGRCVGHNNVRYYLMMLIFLFMSAMYCNYLNFDYAVELFGTFSWKAILTMFIPVVGWLFGFHTTMSFFATVQCGVCLFSSVQFFFLLFFHFRLVMRGHTTYEWRHQMPRVYNHGWKRNLLGVFGSRWYLIWLAPFISSPLPHDGINFPDKNEANGVKDM